MRRALRRLLPAAATLLLTGASAAPALADESGTLTCRIERIPATFDYSGIEGLSWNHYTFVGPVVCDGTESLSGRSFGEISGEGFQTSNWTMPDARASFTSGPLHDAGYQLVWYQSLLGNSATGTFAAPPGGCLGYCIWLEHDGPTYSTDATSTMQLGPVSVPPGSNQVEMTAVLNATFLP